MENQMSFVILSSQIVTYLIAGYVGFVYSKRFKKSLSVTGWVVLIVLTLIAYNIGQGTRLISIKEFSIRLNWLLQGFGVGIIIRYAAQLINNKKMKHTLNTQN